MKLFPEAKYPREIHVGEETYQVRFVKRIPGCGNDVLGLCDPSTRRIYIRLKQTKSQILRTFLHEVLHAIEAEYDVEIKHKQIVKLEKGLADVLLMNW